MRRERADVLLVSRGLVGSRHRARAAILAGEVTADGEPVGKAGQMVSEGASLEIAAPPEYVSRGGVKLARALEVFHIDPKGMVAVDVGASTGGFTDCLLQGGAAKVFAIDVGYGQLAWALRQDPRVIVMERTNVRHLDARKFDSGADIITIDVSFIAVSKILPTVVQLLRAEGALLILVKPQFEGERRDVGKGGIVRDAEAHKRTLTALAQAVADAGLSVRGLTHSPITGADGNIEFWLYAGQGGACSGALDELVDRTVAEAHATFADGSG